MSEKDLEQKEIKSITIDDVKEMHTTSSVTVFIVDDDKFLLDMYSLKFKKAGCIVETSFSGSDALKKLHDGYEPDIIVLDIIMPGMDGLELLEHIRNEKLSSKSKIVMLTNQADDEGKASKLGIDGFITKALHIPSEVVNNILTIYNNKK
jgi:two-component system, OmpR family, response regulator